MNLKDSTPEHTHNTYSPTPIQTPHTATNQKRPEYDNYIYTTHDKNYTYGHDLIQKHKQHTRIIYTNINGITGFPSEFSITNLIDMMEETETYYC